MFESRQPGLSEGDAPPTLLHSGASVSYVTLALAIGVKRNTLHKWVMAGMIPQPTYFGRLARWTAEQVDDIKANGTRPAGTFNRTRALTGPPRVTATAEDPPTSTRPAARKPSVKPKPKSAKKPAAKKRRKP